MCASINNMRFPARCAHSAAAGTGRGGRGVLREPVHSETLGAGQQVDATNPRRIQDAGGHGRARPGPGQPQRPSPARPSGQHGDRYCRQPLPAVGHLSDHPVLQCDDRTMLAGRCTLRGELRGRVCMHPCRLYWASQEAPPGELPAVNPADAGHEPLAAGLGTFGTAGREQGWLNFASRHVQDPAVTRCAGSRPGVPVWLPLASGTRRWLGSMG